MRRLALACCGMLALAACGSTASTSTAAGGTTQPSATAPGTTDRCKALETTGCGAFTTTTAGRSGNSATGTFRSTTGYDYAVAIEVGTPTAVVSELKAKCGAPPRPNEVLVPFSVSVRNPSSGTEPTTGLSAKVMMRSASGWAVQPSEAVNYYDPSTSICTQSGYQNSIGMNTTLDPSDTITYDARIARSFTRADLSKWALLVTAGDGKAIAGITLDGMPLGASDMANVGSGGPTRFQGTWSGPVHMLSGGKSFDGVLALSLVNCGEAGCTAGASITGGSPDSPVMGSDFQLEGEKLTSKRFTTCHSGPFATFTTTLAIQPDGGLAVSSTSPECPDVKLSAVLTKS